MSAESRIAGHLERMLPLVIKIKKHDGPLTKRDKERIKKLRALIRKAKKSK